MKTYLAPMEGITNYIFRNACHEVFYPMDRYFTPFISAKPDKRLSAAEVRELDPENNSGLSVVPQILTNKSADFLNTARLIREYGYSEVNLNLGCPSGTVTAKGKGSGFLKDPDVLDRFLDEVSEGMEKLTMSFSVKTRIGTVDEEDWELLIKIYNRYPLTEVIVHPRIQKDYYKAPVRLKAYEQAEAEIRHPLCYNGDLFTAEDFRRISGRFSRTDTFMFGRGMTANPGLVLEICTGRKASLEQFRRFHDKIYMDYRELLKDQRNTLFRMKELWSYLAGSFSNSAKYAKKIKKSQRFSEYEAAVSSLFAEQELTI